MVVNKADIAGADTAAQQLRALLSLAPSAAWTPPIIMAVALEGKGVAELVDAIDQHQEHLRDSSHADEARRELARAQIVALARASLHREALATAEREGILDQLTQEVAQRRKDPRAAAEALLKAVHASWGRADERG
jgi:LAO/AO transport system kinase